MNMKFKNRNMQYKKKQARILTKLEIRQILGKPSLVIPGQQYTLPKNKTNQT